MTAGDAFGDAFREYAGRVNLTPGDVEYVGGLFARLEAELRQSRFTNQKLHRRCQELESQEQAVSRLAGRLARAVQRAAHATSKMQAAGRDCWKAENSLLHLHESMRRRIAELTEEVARLKGGA